MNGNVNIPLCVDLDGTLVKTDILVESCFQLLKKSTHCFFFLPFWLLQGRARLKHEIARRVDLDASLLPYRREVLEFLKSEWNNGRKLVLATASNVKFASQIAEHFGFFDAVHASDASTNLSGKVKTQILEAAYGTRQFDYIGNGKVDLKVWQKARMAILVNTSHAVTNRAYKMGLAIQSINQADHPVKGFARTIVNTLRIHQWVKNILIFLPLLTAHQFFEPTAFLRESIAFLAFCVCASGVYVLNDLLDMDSDRQHHQKRMRPFASGDLQPIVGLILIPILLGAGIALSFLLPLYFRWVLVSYFVLTTAYSFSFKKKMLLDVLVLAALYTWRIIAGMVAISAPYSPWLFAFSMFIFLSLALGKRYTELHEISKKGGKRTEGRGYYVSDLPHIGNFGAISGFLSVLVMALYLNSKEVTILYAQPKLLWLICFVLLYWVGRFWMLTYRGQVHEDPIVFALKDPVSYFVAVITVGTILFAMRGLW